MYKIIFCNSGGELDSKTVATPAEAANAAAEMIRSAGELYEGDKIVVIDTENP